MDVKPNQEAVVEEVPLPVYKPIEVWKCESIDAALEKCEAEKERDTYVYLEIETDRYIREDEIKQMKSLKADILEILPKIKGQDEIEEETKRLTEQSFEDIFKAFYKKERGTEVAQDVLDVLMNLIGEEEDDETH